MPANTNHILPGERLDEGEFIVSNSGQYYVGVQNGHFAVWGGSPSDSRGCSLSIVTAAHWEMRTDGNLHAWYPTWGLDGAPYDWVSGTSGETCFAIIQDDGNFCIYAGSGPAEQGEFKWGSLQHGGLKVDQLPSHASYLLPGDQLTAGIMLRSPNQSWSVGIVNGVFGVFGPLKISGLPPLYAVGTSLVIAMAETVVMQDDGNLVALRDGPTDISWSSGTGDPPCFAIIQDDGNFCVYGGSGPAEQGDFKWGSLQNGGRTKDLGPYPPQPFMEVYVVNQFNGGVTFHASWDGGQSDSHSLGGDFGSIETVDTTFTFSGPPPGTSCCMTMSRTFDSDYSSGDNFTFGERNVRYKIAPDILNNPRWHRID